MRRFSDIYIRAACMMAVALFLSSTVSYGAIPPEWVPRWEQDLRLAQAQAVEFHPDLFHHISREEWDAQFDELVSRLPTLEHYEIAVELAAIIASVRDGHSRLTLPLGSDIDFMQGHSSTPDPKIDDLRFHQFPVRFFIDSSGVYIRRIDRVHAEALGQKVTRMGTMPIDEAIAAVSPTVRHDNEYQLLHHLPMHLVLAEVLAARGVIDEPAHLEIDMVSAGGESGSIELEAVPDNGSVEWVDAASGGPTPPYLRNTDRNFWFTQLDKTRILYLQFNEVYDSDQETLGDFAKRLSETIVRQRIEAVIVDLRNNRGGDASLSLPLLHAILCSSVNEAGRLYTLVGRTTFSAAMMFALDLERHTETLFVGEPTGSTPNHYGDSRKILLPNTGLTLRISTRYHQNDFTDNRPWITPHLPAEITMDDYVHGRDPGVETVRAIVSDRHERGPLAGSWTGMASVGLNTVELVLDIDPAHTGRVRVPEAELEAAIEEVRISGRTTSFRIETPWGPFDFHLEKGEHWMTGTLGSPSRHYPFVLRRAE